jgi:hypothetical protein
MANPIVAQGTLNKLRASVTFTNNPQLNITASYLAPEGITTTPEGSASAYIPTMVGAVPSPEPYIMYTIEIHMLRTQGLVATYIKQYAKNTTIGDLFVTADASTMPNLVYNNCTLKTLPTLIMNGSTPEFLVTVQGTFYLNSSLFNAV